MQRNATTRRALRALLALLALVCAGGTPGAAVGAGPTQTIRIVNSTGVDPDQVFVTLVPGNGATNQSPAVLPAGFDMGTAYALDPLNARTPWVDEGGNRYSIVVAGPWTSGTILYSLGNGGGTFTGYAAQPPVGTNTNQYDFSELTLDANGSFNGDISAVTQIGIPARLSVLGPDGALADRDGTALPATEYVGCVDATQAVMAGIVAGWTPAGAGVWRTGPGGTFLQLMAPASQPSIYAAYPSFAGYVLSLAGRTLRIRGRFAGGGGLAAAYYDYSGVVAADGSVLLAPTPGTLGLADNADGTGSANYPNPQTIYVAGGELYGHDAGVWPGATGFGVYGQNGPYILNGTGTPATTTGTVMNAIGNDVYGWIYGDLVVSYAMGYWGSDAGLDSAAWNTNGVPPWGTPAGLPAYAAAWSGPAPGFARFNVYQSATSTTGTTYGMSLGDRFAPDGSASPEIGVTSAPQGGSYGTWQVELLARDGCAQLTGISPVSGPAGGGQAVTITGNNLHQGATVTFGGVPATNVTVTQDPQTSRSTVTATTPPAASGGLVDVQVTNAHGSASPPVDTSVLADAYAYPPASGGGPSPATPTAPGTAPAPAPGPAAAAGPVPGPRVPGIALGGGVLRYPGAGCALERTVRAPVAARAARAPVVRVPAGGIMRLGVRGLPRGGEVSADARAGDAWSYLGRARVADGAATLLRFSLEPAGARALVRLRDGRAARYLEVVAGPAAPRSGTALGPHATAYPLGACPSTPAVVRRAAGTSPARAPLARVTGDAVVALRVRGLPRGRPGRVAVRVGAAWRPVGSVATSAAGVAELPPLRLTAPTAPALVRIGNGAAARYVRVGVR